MIYLDHGATTYPLDDVVDAMDPYYRINFQNPAAQYADQAAMGVRNARAEVASLLDVAPESIVFTAGGSEADNLALKGMFDGRTDGHLITSTIEHPAVVETCRWLENRGIDITWITPESDGRVDPGAVEAAIRPETVLISIMHANNETGIIQPIEAIGDIATDRDVCFHSDTVQTVGKIPVKLDAIGLDMASLSAHKLYGPKGAGALAIQPNRRAELEPLIHGGGQEGGLRSGTENVPGIVGLGVAANRANDDLDDRINRLSALRETLIERIETRTNGRLIGHPEHRLPGFALICFDGRSGARIVEALADRDIAVSSGSACHTGSPSPSTVLTEMGVERELAMGAVRFSMGRRTTESDIESTVEALESVLATSPL